MKILRIITFLMHQIQKLRCFLIIFCFKTKKFALNTNKDKHYSSNAKNSILKFIVSILNFNFDKNLFQRIHHFMFEIWCFSLRFLYYNYCIHCCSFVSGKKISWFFLNSGIQNIFFLAFTCTVKLREQHHGAIACIRQYPHRVVVEFRPFSDPHITPWGNSRVRKKWYYPKG